VLLNVRAADIEHSLYELYVLPKDSENLESADLKRAAGVTAIWVARNRFAVLDKAHSVILIPSVSDRFLLIPTSLAAPN